MVTPTPSHEALAQRAAETALEEYLHPAWLDDEYEDDCPCECMTCIVREVLTAAWPHLRDLALSEQGINPTPEGETA